MSTSITTVFIEQFEAEVHVAFQRQGSKLMGTVRKKAISADKTNFFKAGKGTAGTKSRHGLVPLMSLDHNKVPCPTSDYYAADYVDDLDEIRINIDERRVVADAGAMALGRKADDLIVVAASAATGNALIATGAAGLNQTKINTTFQRFGNNDIPDDGQRVFLVPPKGWTDLLGITAFASSDYVGPGELPYKGGLVAKRWLGFLWFPFTGLGDGAGGAGVDTRCIAYHRSAIGLAVGKEVSTKVDWVAERSANLITSKMQMGAVNIDELGIQCVDITD
jgi:hypothetical protein